MRQPQRQITQQLGLRPDPHLGKHVCQMGLCGVAADPQPFDDFIDRSALHQCGAKAGFGRRQAVPSTQQVG